MSGWSSFETMWRLHAETPVFAARLQKAKEIARSGMGSAALPRRMFASISGGKDSVAMLGVIREAGLSIQCAHGASGFDIPGSRETAEAAADACEMDIDIVEPIEDPWELLARIPKGANVFDRKHWIPFCNAAAGGQLMIYYQHQGAFDGAYVGLRAEESKTRLVNARVRGAHYHVKQDDSWMCCPLQWWSVDDVYAFILSRGLPLHPFYRLAYERLQVPPSKSRVDMIMPNEFISSRGALMHLRNLFPELWIRLTDIRPEMRAL